MGSTPTICAISVVKSKDFMTDIFVHSFECDAVSLRKDYYKPKSTCNNNLLQKAICCPNCCPQFMISCAKG